MNDENVEKNFVLGLFLSGLAAFVYFDLGGDLSFSALAEIEEFLRDIVAAHHLNAAAAYVGIYILVVALSLPGAIWLTLSGGLLFGVWLGGALAVLGAGTGAAVMFLMAKYVIGDTLRSRFGARLTRFEAAFNRDARSYLLVLRLLPIFPFFLVNLGAALIGVRFSVFALTTYVGIIPGALVYASIGNGISVLLRQGPTRSVADRATGNLRAAGRFCRSRACAGGLATVSGSGAH